MLSLRKWSIIKAYELSQFCEKMRAIVNEQIQDVERAFTMDTGLYRVTKRFKHLSKTPSQWIKLGKVARDKQIKSIHYSAFKPNLSCVEDICDKDVCDAQRCDPNTGEESFNNTQGQLQLSVSLDEFGLSSSVFGGIWNKALKLVSKPDTIVKSPGSDNMMVCVSYT